MTNKLDQIYRSLRMSRYFVKGWGKPENLKRLCEFRKIVSNREACYKLVSADYPVNLEKEQDEKDCVLIDGSFFTPFAKYMPEVVPIECQKAYFQFVLPKKWSSEDFKPVIVHIAGTGDQFFWRRRHFIAKPLIKEAGIGSIILENPYYGLRKPPDQVRSILENVSDIFVMGGCLMLESLVLFHLCERMGFGPLGITGLSMGGHMASIAATTWPKPLIVVPCLSGLTASHVFTQGVVSQALNWKMLEKQYVSNDCFKNEIQKMLNIIEGDAFKAGQQFVKDLSEGSTESHETFNSRAKNISKVHYDKVTISNQETLSQITDCRGPHAITASRIPVPSDPNLTVDRELNDCDNYSKAAFDNTITQNVTSNSNILEKFGRSQNDKKSEVLTANEEERQKAETTNKLLNLIVRLTRASINLNILSAKTGDEIENIKPATTSAGEQQAFNFMNGIMDECTHLKHYSVPVDTSLAIAVCADDDAYVPKKGMTSLDQIWPGAEVRYVRGGHVRAYVQHQKEFRHAIIDAFNKYRSKYVHKTEQQNTAAG